ncbi:MAG: hypothetical protein ACYDAY_02890 [Candidatus Dormibacteria bacterium]
MTRFTRIAVAVLAAGAIAAPAAHATSPVGDSQTYEWTPAGAACLNTSQLSPSAPDIHSGGACFDLTTAPLVSMATLTSITITDAAIASPASDWSILSAPNPVSGTQVVLASGTICNGSFSGTVPIDPTASTLFVSVGFAPDAVTCGPTTAPPVATTGVVTVGGLTA